MIFEGPNIRFNDAALNKLLNDPKGGRGTVGAYMRKIGLQILAESKVMVGVRTGTLRRSLSMRQGLRGRVQYVAVGSKLPYAAAHHEGTRSHLITASTGRIMRFNVGGKVVYAQKVNHPGTEPNNYLTVPMRRAVRGR